MNQKKPKLMPSYESLVPHYMRTNRLAPRLLAGLLCLFSTLVFYQGTQALGRQQQAASRSPFDTISPGESSFIIEVDKSCLAAFDIALTPKKSLETNSTLTANALFRVSSQQKSRLVSLQAKAVFDYLGELSQLDIEIDLNKLGKIILYRQKPDSPLLARIETAQGVSRTISLFTLDRVYLLEPRENSFRLRLPQSLKGTQSWLATSAPGAWQMKQTVASEARTCREKILKSTNTQTPTLLQSKYAEERVLDPALLKSLTRMDERK